ncbi:MAG: glycosyltransferase family 4 protein [Chloroflexi bacterium]|nr:glycosyltransferase family 4 protein [Chloroflexota bacterium]MBU1749940.1 glycosyltransferase family 4 protein [Chloroflexota bacterium]
MRILVLAHFYPPEMGGAAARLHGLARWLVRYGHQVTVVTGLPNYPTGLVPAGYRGRWRVRETMDGVDVLRTWVYASSHRGSLRRLANYFSFVVSAIIAGLTTGRSYDVILASSPPLFIGLAGLALARMHRVPWVFDIRDLWPDVAVEAGEFAPDAAITRLGYGLARFLYRQSDHITPVTENKRQKLLTAGVPAAKLTIVPNGVDLDLVAPADGDKRAELGLTDQFVILYAGLIGIAQGVEVVVEAADRLRAHPNIHFLIVGDGVRREALAHRVAQLGLSNVTLLPRQPREQIPAFMAAANVCLVPLVSSKLEDAVPSKLLEAWAYGRPVILAAGGEAAGVVQQSGGGMVVPPEEPGRLADAVLALSQAPDQLARYAEQGHRYVRERLDRPTLAQQMEVVLQTLVQARSRP